MLCGIGGARVAQVLQQRSCRPLRGKGRCKQPVFGLREAHRASVHVMTFNGKMAGSSTTPSPRIHMSRRRHASEHAIL
jgi:hypothetical protein